MELILSMKNSQSKLKDITQHFKIHQYTVQEAHGVPPGGLSSYSAFWESRDKPTSCIVSSFQLVKY